MGINSNRNRSYSNGEITVFWCARDCVHATTCYNSLRSVFDPLKRPWVNMGGAPTDQILEIIEKCPSKALTFRWNDEQKNQSETSSKLFVGNASDFINNGAHSVASSEDSAQEACQASINIRPNGPIVVSGNFEVRNHRDAKMGSWKMVSICRCGRSGNLPHCDGTHFKIGFKAR